MSEPSLHSELEPMEVCVNHPDGDDCPRINGLRITHSHSVGEPKTYQCELSCVIGACADTRHCPKCYSRNVEMTTMGVLQGPDTNKAACRGRRIDGKCGWKGIVEDLLRKPLNL